MDTEVEGFFKCKILDAGQDEDENPDFEGQASPIKGQLRPGEKITLKFGDSPPEEDDFLNDIPNLKMMGQWIKKSGEILIYGGHVMENEPTGLQCKLVLKAFINNP